MAPKMDDFVSRIVKDPKNPPNTLLLKGYLGVSSEEGHVRLYLDTELSDYFEIPQDAILYSHEIPKEKSPIGGSYVWIERDATLIHGPVVTERPKASFLEGRIMMTQACAAGFELPRTGTGPNCGTIIDGCTDAGPRCPSQVTCPAPCTTKLGTTCTHSGPNCPTVSGTTCPTPCTHSGPNCPQTSSGTTCPASSCTQTGPTCKTSPQFTCSGPNCPTTPDTTCCGPNCPSFPPSTCAGPNCPTVSGTTCPAASCTHSGPNCQTVSGTTCPAASCTHSGPNCPTVSGTTCPAPCGTTQPGSPCVTKTSRCTESGPECTKTGPSCALPTEAGKTCVGGTTCAAPCRQP